MMQLQLLGVLQDYDSPYASLYQDKDSQKLYLAVEQDSGKPKEFCALLLHVSKMMVVFYLQHKIGLREIANEVTDKFLWHRKKGQQGTFTSLKKSDASQYIDMDDDMFDSEFCNEYDLIKYYLNN